jgi:hypothetical protein
MLQESSRFSYPHNVFKSPHNKRGFKLIYCWSKISLEQKVANTLNTNIKTSHTHVWQRLVKLNRIQFSKSLIVIEKTIVNYLYVYYSLIFLLVKRVLHVGG